jgi:hypothetical protein
MLNLLSNPRALVALVVAIVLGFILGFVIAWNIPATDLPPALLHPGYRDFYLAFVADQYARTGNFDLAQTQLGVDDRWSSKQVAADLRKLAATPGRADKAQLESLASKLEQTVVSTTPTRGPNLLLIALLALSLVALIAIGVVVVWPRVRGEPALARPQAAAVRSAQASKSVEPTATWDGTSEKPLAQFVTAYEIGDDRYDTSFSIETAAGDFLGECGVGISETIGVGEPSKVTAFEVWLFDKNDIRTVTKVLMSEYAYGDQALRTKLAPKGEPELARPDAVIELETATLKVRARVVDMEYGTGELEPRSFFSKLNLELAVWPKETVPAAA